MLYDCLWFGPDYSINIITIVLDLARDHIKINNNHKRYLAHEIRNKHPELKPYIEVRKAFAP